MTIREVGLTSEEVKKIKDEFDKSIADHDKRIRAEVLASAITLFAQREPHHRAWAEPVRLLRNLQPAASDLEALLRVAELRGLHTKHSTAHSHEPYACNGEVLCAKCVRMAESEKARAEGEG